jgi:hypothetical protein
MKTYRIGTLNDPQNVGKMASSQELARRYVAHLDRSGPLVMERTVWANGKRLFTVLDDAEHYAGEWHL